MLHSNHCKKISTRHDPGFKNVGILFFLTLNICFANSQDTLGVEKKVYFRAAFGLGVGSGFPLQEDALGIAANIDFDLQKNRSVYTLGARQIGEFQLFNNSNINNAVNSLDVKYGRVFKGSFFSSISAGIAWVIGVQKGQLLSREGGWFSSFSKYEKITYYTIGLPISAKILWMPIKSYGLGAELYVNINAKNPFYGINFCHQFGKVKADK
ncbi:MAG: hypothetical protein ABIO55_02070 [Ginsengibacter sp.]